MQSAYDMIYCPIACDGHYDAKVLSKNNDGSVDIELDKTQTGPGEVMVLHHIAVVPTLVDLKPGTCCSKVAA